MKTGEDAVGLLLDALNGQLLDYMVVGSFSSNRYGVPRATKDADFVLRIMAAQHDTLDVLAEAKAEASVVWEADELENGPH